MDKRGTNPASNTNKAASPSSIPRRILPAKGARRPAAPSQKSQSAAASDEDDWDPNDDIDALDRVLSSFSDSDSSSEADLESSPPPSKQDSESAPPPAKQEPESADLVKQTDVTTPAEPLPSSQEDEMAKKKNKGNKPTDIKTGASSSNSQTDSKPVTTTTDTKDVTNTNDSKPVSTTNGKDQAPVSTSASSSSGNGEKKPEQAAAADASPSPSDGQTDQEQVSDVSTTTLVHQTEASADATTPVSARIGPAIFTTEGRIPAWQKQGHGSASPALFNPSYPLSSREAYFPPPIPSSRPSSSSSREGPSFFPQAFTNPSAPTSPKNRALDAQGFLGSAADVPATPSARYDASSKSPDELAKDNKRLLEENVKLKREYENLKASSATDYDKIAYFQDYVPQLEKERNLYLKQRDEVNSNWRIQVNKLKMVEAERDNAKKPFNEERARHAQTTIKLRDELALRYDNEKIARTARAEAADAQKEVKELKRILADKEATLAGADEQFVELQKELQAAQEEAEKGAEGIRWLEVMNKDLDRSFASLGMDLTAENVVKRMMELEQQQAGHINRATSNSSLDARDDFGQTLPKHRNSGSRKISLGDELARAVADDDDDKSDDGAVETKQEEVKVVKEVPVEAQQDDVKVMTDAEWAAKFDDSSVPYKANNAAQKDVQDHGLQDIPRDAETFLHDEPAQRMKSTSTLWDGEESLLSSLLTARQEAAKAAKEKEESAERIKALEKELAARPVNGTPVGVVAAPVVVEKKEEKSWWEAVLGAPWWAKLVLLLLVLLWATTTMSAAIERQRWVTANVTPEMVRFYASPPSLGGVVGRLVGRGHGYGMHG